MSDNPDTDAVRSYLLDLRERICETIQAEEWRVRFHETPWQPTRGGQGGVRPRMLSDGDIFKTAAVSFSYIQGKPLSPPQVANRSELTGRSRSAMGLSLAIHPLNPYVSPAYGHIAYFLTEKDDAAPIWWFNSDFQLKPHIGSPEDAVRWQNSYTQTGSDGESQAIELHEMEFEEAFSLAREFGNRFLQGYLSILERSKNTPYGNFEL